MVKTDTYAKLLSALASLAFLCILFGLILYVIIATSPYWLQHFYNKHFDTDDSTISIKNKTHHFASWLLLGAIIALILIEIFSKGYLQKRQKHEFILTHLQMQLENKI